MLAGTVRNSKPCTADRPARLQPPLPVPGGPSQPPPATAVLGQTRGAQQLRPPGSMGAPEALCYPCRLSRRTLVKRTTQRAPTPVRRSAGTPLPPGVGAVWPAAPFRSCRGRDASPAGAQERRAAAPPEPCAVVSQEETQPQRCPRPTEHQRAPARDKRPLRQRMVITGSF